MSDASQQKLSLSTIAVCAVFICGSVFWATQKYDAIGESLDALVKGQTQDHAWLVAIDSKVSDHEKQLDLIIAQQEEARTAASANSKREKKFEQEN